MTGVKVVDLEGDPEGAEPIELRFEPASSSSCSAITPAPVQT